MRLQSTLILIYATIIMTVKLHEKENTLVRLKEIRKMDTLGSSFNDADGSPVFKEKEIIKTYHHIIKKILPPYPGDDTTDIHEHSAKNNKDFKEIIFEKYILKNLTSYRNKSENFRKRNAGNQWQMKNSEGQLRKLHKAKHDLKSFFKNKQEKSKKRYKNQRVNRRRQYLTNSLYRKHRNIDNNVPKITDFTLLYPTETVTIVATNSSVQLADSKNYPNNQTNTKAKRNEVLIRVYGEDQHVEQNYSKLVLTKNTENKTLKSFQKMEENTAQYSFENIARKQTYSIPAVSAERGNFDFHSTETTTENVEYHVVFHHTKVITDYAPIKSKVTTSFATRRWYPFAIRKKVSTGRGKTKPAAPKKMGYKVSQTRITPSAKIYQPIIPPKMKFRNFMISPSTQLKHPIISSKLQFKQPIISSKTQFKQPVISSKAQLKQPVIYYSFPTQFEQPVIPPTTQFKQPIIAPPIQFEQPIYPPSTQLMQPDITTTEISLEEVIKQIENQLPDGKIEMVTHEVKIKEEVFAFEPNTNMNASLNKMSRELATKEKELKISSILLWLLGMLCLLVIVVLAFMIYITEVRDSIYGIFDRHKETEPHSIQDTAMNNRLREDLRILHERIQQALNECHFYPESELMQIYSKTKQAKRMMNPNKD